MFGLNKNEIFVKNFLFFIADDINIAVNGNDDKNRYYPYFVIEGDSDRIKFI